MWGFEDRSALARAAAAVSYLASVALLVLLQEIGLRLRREERRAWWAGNGRDLLNAVGFAAVATSLRAYGFPLAGALFAGATLTLTLFGTCVYMETQARTSRRRAWALLLGVAFAAPLLVFPTQLLNALARAATALFPFWN